MKKRIKVLALSLFLILTLSGCGTDLNKQKTIYGVEHEGIVKSMKAIGEATGELSMKEIKAYKERFDKSLEEAKTDKDKNEAQMYSDFFEKIIDHKSELGDFEGFGKLKIEKAGKTVTCTLKENYSKRDAQLIFVYKIVKDKMTLSAINFNPVYSKGEILGKAGLNVLMGMLIVFSVLIIISLIIYAFKLIPYIEARRKKAKSETKEVLSQEESEPDLEDDLELVAVIAAAISAYTGKSTDDFVVRKIKRR